jgi:hypothetical protein
MSDGPSVLSLSRPRALALAFSALGGALALIRPQEVAPGAVLAAIGVLAAVPVAGRSLADLACRLAGYLSRSRWTRMGAHVAGDVVDVIGRGRAVVVLESIEPRGRLDLAGADGELASDLAALCERASRCGADRAVSWHVTREGDAARLVVARPPDVAGLPGATSANDEVAGFVPGPWVLERWRHARSADAYHCAWRASGEDPLVGWAAALAAPGTVVTTALRVVAHERADRLAGRLAHRWRVDTAIAQRLGFRPRARDAGRGAGLERREGHVAAGRALLVVDVIVRVSAPSREELAARSSRATSMARRVGVRLVREDGAHAPALCAQLPGMARPRR